MKSVISGLQNPGILQKADEYYGQQKLKFTKHDKYAAKLPGGIYTIKMHSCDNLAVKSRKYA